MAKEKEEQKEVVQEQPKKKMTVAEAQKIEAHYASLAVHPTPADLIEARKVLAEQ